MKLGDRERNLFRSLFGKNVSSEADVYQNVMEMAQRYEAKIRTQAVRLGALANEVADSRSSCTCGAAKRARERAEVAEAERRAKVQAEMAERVERVSARTSPSQWRGKEG